MTWTRLFVFVALAVILGVPFALKPASVEPGRDVPHLIIITPHVRQISTEFGEGFSAWHKRTFGSEVFVDWRGPLGTSEIISMLRAQYTAALERGDIAPDGSCKPGTIGFDVMLGGGTYDHKRLADASAAQAVVGGKTVGISMSIPAGLSEQVLAPLNPNEIGSEKLYDPKQCWIGTALSSFGIVSNTDTLAGLGINEPIRSFAGLADPRLVGMVALADPRQSGSVTTVIDLILNSTVVNRARAEGWDGLLMEKDWLAKATAAGKAGEIDEQWDRAWRLLREITANTRYFTNSSTKPPIDISQGEAATGLAIDFYGRTQGQSILRPGQDASESRVVYVDPVGATAYDPDPVSILRGGPNFQLAQRFVEYCLTEEAQALWQFPSARNPKSSGNPRMADGQLMGPRQYELRRMPIRRDMYAKYPSAMIDKSNPFQEAIKIKPLGWRDCLLNTLPAFSIDVTEEQRAAWRALNRARADTSFPPERLAEMEKLFYAFPTTELPGGKAVAFRPAEVGALIAAWKENKDGFKARYKIEAVKFFKANYRRVVELSRS